MQKVKFVSTNNMQPDINKKMIFINLLFRGVKNKNLAQIFDYRPMVRNLPHNIFLHAESIWGDIWGCGNDGEIL